MEIRSYNDFVTALFNAGFSMGGGNSEVQESLCCNYRAKLQPPFAMIYL